MDTSIGELTNQLYLNARNKAEIHGIRSGGFDRFTGLLKGERVYDVYVPNKPLVEIIALGGSITLSDEINHTTITSCELPSAYKSELEYVVALNDLFRNNGIEINPKLKNINHNH